MNPVGSPPEPFYGPGSPNESLPTSLMPTSAVCVSAGLSASNIALGACLIVGAFLSYGPQVRRSLKNANCEISTFPFHLLTSLFILSSSITRYGDENQQKV